MRPRRIGGAHHGAAREHRGEPLDGKGRAFAEPEDPEERKDRGIHRKDDGARVFAARKATGEIAVERPEGGATERKRVGGGRFAQVREERWR